uniref:Methylenetetrahydrofolate dehydrogenase n=1 Tax=Paulinella micropora TaxID=1928728 RepID=A0A385I174_9EUKA|nr:methylenetetrahydrofolate dehydrogenase [Paulinella micropora]AXY63687.1 methylenetetrahydrofolate dehydrogenase [Paulinella micropora]
MAFHINGRRLASEIEQHLAAVIQRHQNRAGRPPGLAVLRIGDDPASGVYVNNKEKACERIGISRHGAHISKDITLEEMLHVIHSMNEDPLIDAILLQLPLPSSLDPGILLEAISPEKDADGLHTLNLGRLLKGEPGPRSCTPSGIMALLANNKIPLEGQHAVVIGRSILVGKPMALMLQSANATVTMAHSHTIDLSSITRQADILVVAAGSPQLIGARHIKPNAVVIDVGIHRVPIDEITENGSKSYLCGDINSNELEEIASALTPVPGGVGPMTVAMLLTNTVMNWGNRCTLDNPLEDLVSF